MKVWQGSQHNSSSIAPPYTTVPLQTPRHPLLLTSSHTLCKPLTQSSNAPSFLHSTPYHPIFHHHSTLFSHPTYYPPPHPTPPFALTSPFLPPLASPLLPHSPRPCIRPSPRPFYRPLPPTPPHHLSRPQRPSHAHSPHFPHIYPTPSAQLYRR